MGTESCGGEFMTFSICVLCPIRWESIIISTNDHLFNGREKFVELINGF